MVRTMVIATACLLFVACSSYHEVATSGIANEVVRAEFHEGGMTIGPISDPLEIADWEMRIAASGAVEQKMFDASAGVWRIFAGRPLARRELASIISECEALPSAESNSAPVILGQLATDTTFLRIVLHSPEATRDVTAYAPRTSSAEFFRFLQVWNQIARQRPVPQSPRGSL